MSTDLLERMKAALAQAAAREWQTPAHDETNLATVSHEDLGLDPYNYSDPLVRKIYEAQEQADPLRFVKDAVNRGFHVFGLQPKSKITIPGSHGFKDAKQPSDPDVFHPWNEDPTRNVGIALGESDLCVLDFDTEKDIPQWLNQTKTYKVKTSRGVHVYFRGARPSTGLYIGGKKVGDIKSTGGYVLAAGSVHPDGPIYTVIDDSPIASTPDLSGLLKQEEKTPVNASPDGPPIPFGSHDTELTRIAGVLRNASMNPQDIEEHLIRVCERRCEGYGSDYKEMCRKIAKSIGKKPVGQAAPPVIFGGNVVGQNSAPNEALPENWLKQFRSVDEMEEGPIVMVINGVLQEGICFIGANPGDGKTWIALAFAKAISTGTPLFDMLQYDVPVPRTVIYLIPESRDRAFRKRCEAFEMPKDKMKFMTRTISAGIPLQLSDPNLLEAVRQTKAVVFLDTAARFMRGTDENAAAQNRLLVNDVVALLAAGATTVVLVHHATKEAKQKKMAMTLENMLRGSSDLGAMCDQAYGIRKDMGLYANGSGPMEIDLVDLKDREDVGTLTSIRLAASYKKPGSIFPVSYFNEKHNFQVVDDTAAFKRKVDSLVAMVTQDPDLPEKELAERAALSTYMVKHYLNGRGFHRVQGGRGGASPWHQDNGQPCPYEKAKKGSSGINLDSPEKRPKPVVN
jgi:Bifunctional DNA primase/polymerase, N-terminal/AAA domain